MEVFEGKECEVTRLTYRGAHGITSFMVAPDGTAPDSASESKIMKARQQYMAWLENNAGLFDFLAVDIPCKKIASSFPAGKEPFAHLNAHDQDILHTIELTLNRLFEPDPAIKADEMLDQDLGAELDLEPEDYGDVVRELEMVLPIKFPQRTSTIFRPPFNTVRDILNLVNSAAIDKPQQRQRRRKRRETR